MCLCQIQCCCPFVMYVGVPLVKSVLALFVVVGWGRGGIMG